MKLNLDNVTVGVNMHDFHKLSLMELSKFLGAFKQINCYCGQCPNDR